MTRLELLYFNRQTNDLYLERLLTGEKALLFSVVKVLRIIPGNCVALDFFLSFAGTRPKMLAVWTFGLLLIRRWLWIGGWLRGRRGAASSECSCDDT